MKFLGKTLRELIWFLWPTMGEARRRGVLTNDGLPPVNVNVPMPKVKPPVERKCGACGWSHLVDAYTIGDCRKNAPIINVKKYYVDIEMREERTEYETIWPSVDKNDWCGEWSAKKEEPVFYSDNKVKEKYGLD